MGRHRGCTVSHSESTRLKMSKSQKEYYKTHNHAMLGIPRSEETRRKSSETRLAKGLSKGSNNGNWNGGSSFAPYCPAFNNQLKEAIRNRDNRTCVLCGKSELLNHGFRLSVHHIDGDKMQGCDNKTWFLCSLCISCNSKTDTLEKEFVIVSNLAQNLKGVK